MPVMLLCTAGQCVHVSVSVQDPLRFKVGFRVHAGVSMLTAGACTLEYAAVLGYIGKALKTSSGCSCTMVFPFGLL